MTDINHLRQWISFLKNLQHPDDYFNIGELFEKYGKEYEIGPHTFSGKRMKRHGCFQNSANLVFENSNLIYVEGYVSVMGVPLEHAWVIDKAAPTIVIDPTLEKPNFDSEYLGIPFNTEYVRKTVLKTKVWGIISHTNRTLFKKDNDFSKIII